eukprot:CAMPEP_0115872380 /NCGR_PEP_ID=MMETSP0287-20121206/23390_1 /TAXON_ID=412157 /ORGANISM="Chrysochromulina rotalis, Strain UIO044" /LENGTH=176 /DNA_ID=CAMNT_0003327287 /DNA_START=23 /DNA_END=550 /DNA_ORIENTATION=+
MWTVNVPPPVGILEAPLPTIHSGRASCADEQQWPVLSAASVESRGSQVLERHHDKTFGHKSWHLWRASSSRRQGKQAGRRRYLPLPDNVHSALFVTLVLLGCVAFIAAVMSMSLEDAPPPEAIDVASDAMEARARQHRPRKHYFEKLDFDQLKNGLSLDRNFWRSAQNHAGFDLLH